MDHPLHPARAIVLATPFAFFLGAMLSDWAYSGTFGIQWKNFASWLIVGGLIAATIAIVTQAVAALRHRHRLGIFSLLVMIATFVAGVFNALVHAKDAWAAMPTGLVLSIVTMLLALAAAWIGLTPTRRAGVSA